MFFLQIASTNQIACETIRYSRGKINIYAHIFNTDGSADLSAMSASSAFRLLRATKDALQAAVQMRLFAQITFLFHHNLISRGMNGICR
jgi:hypothetical protein